LVRTPFLWQKLGVLIEVCRLASYGGAGPISATGGCCPIATPTIAGYSWKLFYGLNGSMKVYSFVISSSPLTNFSGDIKAFYTYLINNEGYPSSQYLISE
jgi:xyloglucan-specific endo-beta-1,4-glucanase